MLRNTHHAAWHFWFTVIFVVKVVCGNLV
nr:DUF3265 domain-containing protein [Vibrio vulnificus]